MEPAICVSDWGPVAGVGGRSSLPTVPDWIRESGCPGPSSLVAGSHGGWAQPPGAVPVSHTDSSRTWDRRCSAGTPSAQWRSLVSSALCTHGGFLCNVWSRQPGAVEALCGGSLTPRRPLPAPWVVRKRQRVRRTRGPAGLFLTTPSSTPPRTPLGPGSSLGLASDSQVRGRKGVL